MSPKYLGSVLALTAVSLVVDKRPGEGEVGQRQGGRELVLLCDPVGQRQKVPPGCSVGVVVPPAEVAVPAVQKELRDCGDARLVVPQRVQHCAPQVREGGAGMGTWTSGSPLPSGRDGAQGIINVGHGSELPVSIRGFRV